MIQRSTPAPTSLSSHLRAIRHPELRRTSRRYLNFLVMTKCAALETFEVALVVITIGLSSTAWFEALTGASIALALTVGLVISLHGYLHGGWQNFLFPYTWRYGKNECNQRPLPCFTFNRYRAAV